MLKDVAPWIIGPAGIVLGWWLNQHTLRGNAERQAQQAEEVAARQRVLDAVSLARDAASHVRSVLHAVHMKHQYGRAPTGFAEMMDEFNTTRDRFRNALLALRVQGPSWAVEGADRLDVEIAKYAELAFVIQKGVTAEHMDSVNSGLPQLDRTLRDYVSTVSRKYNPDSSKLPAQPDMETEGRWKSAES